MIALTMTCDRCGVRTNLHGSIAHTREDALARGWTVSSEGLAQGRDYCSPECLFESLAAERQAALDAESRGGSGSV